MKRLNIGYFTNTYLPVVSGVVRSVSTYRQALSKIGHNVFVFAQEDDYQDEEPFIFRYPSIPLPIDVNIPAVIPVSPRMDWLIPNLKLDVIHTHHPVLVGQVAATKAVQLKLPLIFTFHTQYREYTHYIPIPQETVQHFLNEAIHDWLKSFMQKCQHIIVPSESMLDILQTEFGLDSNYSVVPTGIDLEPYRQADGTAIREQHGWKDSFVLISVGRLSKEKNWEFFLRAAAEAMRDLPDLRVALLGNGPHKKNLEKLVKELGIKDKVDFLGEVSFEQVPDYLKAADIFGFASTSETQGLVTMEAMATGLPVVAIDAAGTRDILQDGVQGFMVEIDLNAFSSAIKQLRGSPRLLLEFSRAAQERAAKFDIFKLSKQMLDIYGQAIEEKKADKTVRLLVEN
jgi:1,2-diacylglycerol 3-alpha-glucosyltransferase